MDLCPYKEKNMEIWMGTTPELHINTLITACQSLCYIAIYCTLYKAYCNHIFGPELLEKVCINYIVIFISAQILEISEFPDTLGPLPQPLYLCQHFQFFSNVPFELLLSCFFHFY